MPEYKIIFSKNIAALKLMADNSVDSIVTDSPYGLKFMNKRWDYDVPSVEFWIECLRVLKPGGHVLCFGGTRTYHRMTINIEDAGFEIRDCIQWLYGSGFPKSMDISKAIDKQAGAEREVVGMTKGKGGENLNQLSRPEANDSEGAKGMGAYGQGAKQITVDIPVTAPATDAAKQWEGWGTALKPANEPIVMARKPISEKTVADNVLKWGTGCIWIDGCRIEFLTEEDKISAMYGTGTDICGGNFASGEHQENGLKNIEANDLGRWPANIILDEVAAIMLDEQAPSTGAFAMSPIRSGESKGVYGDFETRGDNGKSFRNDTGGASRFFYIAKPSQEERNRGLYGKFEPKKVNDGRQKDNDTAFQRGKKIRLNIHPTVKPISLMRYLVKMVTPKGGLCLDPFCGSGTTIIGCKLELINGIGIDDDEVSCQIAEARLTKWNPDLYKTQTLF